MLYIWPWHAPELPPQRLISSMMTEASARPEPGAAVFLRDQRRQPAGLGQRVDELHRITTRVVELAPVLVGILSAKIAQRFAQLLVLVGSGYVHFFLRICLVGNIESNRMCQYCAGGKRCKLLGCFLVSPARTSVALR